MEVGNCQAKRLHEISARQASRAKHGLQARSFGAKMSRTRSLASTKPWNPFHEVNSDISNEAFLNCELICPYESHPVPPNSRIGRAEGARALSSRTVIREALKAMAV